MIESEFWKSSFTIDDVTLYLAGFKDKDRAVYRIGNSDLYRCCVYDRVMGMRIIGERASQEDVTWEEASKFLG